MASGPCGHNYLYFVYYYPYAALYHLFRCLAATSHGGVPAIDNLDGVRSYHATFLWGTTRKDTYAQRGPQGRGRKERDIVPYRTFIQ